MKTRSVHFIGVYEWSLSQTHSYSQSVETTRLAGQVHKQLALDADFVGAGGPRENYGIANQSADG